MTQPEALRLAEDLEIDYFGDVVAHDAAAELRRLAAVEAEMLAMRRVFSEAGCTFDVAYIRRLLRAEAASCSNTFDCQCPKHFASQQSEQRPKRVLTAVWRDRAQRAEAQRDALLEAAKEAEPMLQAMLDSIRKTLPQYTKMPALEKLRAAIKAVEGEEA